MLKLIKALVISMKAHKGQKDKAGKKYIFHPIKVAMLSKGYKTKIVALLHDVIEDSEVTIEDLSKHFDEDIVLAVDCITKKKGQDYQEYLNIVKNNELSRKVKIADLTHNSNLNRLEKITEKDRMRKEKYLKAIEFLRN
ncbi:HD domain-containing protein [uncultured Parvimonas sp.]|uniref:HD domain-containing protein n=1 Tax=Parvimonas parva TaxID=2769485 RepID=UPI002595DC6C|nr:HD domain-containing protein [uncultured Parvimonas sp.]